MFHLAPRMAGLSGFGSEQTATEVHLSVCTLVATHALKHAAWAEYAAVMLDAETEAFFKARLGPDKAADGSCPPPSKKKRKQHAEAGDAASAEIVVPEMSLRVACLDGSTLSVTAPRSGIVGDVKRTIGEVRGMAVGLIELFVEGTEDALENAASLASAGFGDGSVVFMLQKL